MNDLNVLAYQHPSDDRAAIADAVMSVFGKDPENSLAGVDGGWFGIGLDDLLGGSGGGLGELAPVLEACGAATSASVLPWTTGIIAQLLVGSARHDLVGDVAAGSVTFSIPALALTDAPYWLQASADGATITGSAIALGRPDGWLAVPLIDDAESCLVLVPPDHDLVDVEPLTAMDITRPWARYDVRGVPVADVEVVDVRDLGLRWRALAGTVFGLDAVGTARTALAETIRYASVRKQFGRPIGSFQAYKHLCANAFIELKLAQSIAFRTADSFGHADEAAYWSATVIAARSATQICAQAIQLHGGMGFSWESGIHRFVRRARADEVLSDIDGATRQLLTTALASAA